MLRRLSGSSAGRTFEERREQLERDGPATFVAELLRLAADPAHGAVRVSKPELAEQLSRLLLDEIESREWGSALARRPLLQRAEVIFRLAALAVRRVTTRRATRSYLGRRAIGVLPQPGSRLALLSAIGKEPATRSTGWPCEGWPVVRRLPNCGSG